MVRVLVIDDHAVVRGGIARLLERAVSMTMIGEGSSGADALRLARDVAADVCVLDLDMPGGGISLIERLRAANPSLRILVFSQHDERDFAVRCLQAGAHGYLSKDTGLDVLEEAIRRVASGRRYLSEEASERLLAGLGGEDGPGPPHRRLTSRELEVVRMLARGMRATDIASELGVSVKTVSTHRANALVKLGLSSTVELALYARDQGLV